MEMEIKQKIQNVHRIVSRHLLHGLKFAYSEVKMTNRTFISRWHFDFSPKGTSVVRTKDHVCFLHASNNNGRT